jgi:nitrite reductase/ring-hydroxylating ferredoxin subunit
MLSHEDNELLVRTGPGTPMGELLRRYWMPVVQSGELPAGGRVKRVQILCERLIAYRAPDGTPGLIAEFCPHRSASLYFGRNEDGGMRCPYHGWKFAQDGRCVEMPSEPAESSFASKVRTTAYPCVERGGIMFAYMGPGAPPEFPDFEFAHYPESHVFTSKRVQDCNWFQAMEGGIDSSHISFLHSPLRHTDDSITKDMDRVSFGVGAAVSTGDRAPRFDCVDTDYGVLIGARRNEPDGRWHWRVTQYCLPFWTMPPAGVGEKVIQSHIWVPMDDTHVVNWMVTWHTERPLTPEEIQLHVEGKGAHVCDYAPATSDPYGDVRTAANRENDYLMDWDVHRTRMYCGIPGFGVQDQAVQESQGPGAIVDRSLEHLGTSDTAIIHIRKRLMMAARALRDHGTPAPGVDRPKSFCVRSASAVLPAGAAWLEAVKPLVVASPGQTLALI